jgi:hypothetical protein
MTSEDLIALLVRLVGDPADLEARRRAAVALDRRGASEQAQALLAPLVNLTEHDESARLPCLCKACLPAAGREASAEGMSFRRAFVIHAGRVLHFWLPEELTADRDEIDRSVGEAMRSTAARKAKQRAS